MVSALYSFSEYTFDSTTPAGHQRNHRHMASAHCTGRLLVILSHLLGSQEHLKIARAEQMSVPWPPPGMSKDQAELWPSVLCHQSISNVHDRLAAASLPANGSYLQCSVRLHEQLEFGRTNIRPVFLNQTLIILVDNV